VDRLFDIGRSTKTIWRWVDRQPTV